MYCPKCGEKIPNDSQFCPNCGEKIRENLIIKTQSKQLVVTKKASWENYPIFFIGIAVMIASLFFKWYLNVNFESIKYLNIVFFVYPFYQAINGESIDRKVLIISAIIPAILLAYGFANYVHTTHTATNYYKHEQMTKELYEKGGFIYLVGYVVTLIGGWLRR